MLSITKLQRITRKWHSKISAIAFIFFFTISVTAVLLGWKNLFASKIYSTLDKQIISKKTNEWLPLDSLQKLAFNGLRQKVPGAPEAKVIALSARLDKGYVRFTFDSQYNVQLNAGTGELQIIEKRASDLFIKIHDGEILDELFNTKNGAIKTTYTSIFGFGLFFLTLTGFWMRYGPKKSSLKLK